MDPDKNPYTPGAGSPPPELAGRNSILKKAKTKILQTKGGGAPKSFILLGLRGVGKTVLLNRIEQIAETEGCQTASIETDLNRTLPELLTQELRRLLLRLDRSKHVTHEIKKAFDFLRSFASIFKVKIGEIEVSISSESATGDLSIDLTDLFVAIGKGAKSRESVAVIIMDEMQYLRKDSLSALMIALHKISQKKLPLLLFGAGLPQLAKLAGEAKTYSERLFDYPEIGSLDAKSARAALVEPAKRESVTYEDEALDLILKETQGYPYFLQLWGECVWNFAPSSPITFGHVKTATKHAIKSLHENFFKMRLDRLTERQQQYARVIAELGPDPARSTAVANELGLTVQQAAPIRDELIKKGVAYSPSRGRVTFTVPKFDEFIKRKVPRANS